MPADTRDPKQTDDRSVTNSERRMNECSLSIEGLGSTTICIMSRGLSRGWRWSGDGEAGQVGTDDRCTEGTDKHLKSDNHLEWAR